jgi:hypothetical protein
MWGRPSAGYAQEVIACPIAVNLSVCLCRAASTRSHKGSKASLSVMVENDDVAAFSGQRRTYTRSGESGKEGALRILSPMWSDHTMAHRHRPQPAGLCWRCFRRYPREQEDRPRRLRGATLTLRKSVTHSARFQVRDHFAARRRPAEKPDKLEARSRRGLEPMTGKMQVKKSWQLAEQHGLWWAYEGDLPPPEAFQTHSRPRPVPILGPYPSRTIAEALLRRHLERRRD